MTVLTLIKHNNPFLRLASLQFVSVAAIGIVIPYINLYLIEANFSATLIGTLSSVGAILALSITPWLSHIADRRLLHRRLFMFYMLLFAVANIIFANFTNQIFLIIAALIFPVTIGPGLTLGMQLTMTQIAEQKKDILGQVRSFAALGFSVAGLVAGRLFTWGGYSFLFWVSALLAFITIQVATIFPSSSKARKNKVAKVTTKRSRAFYVLLVSHFFISIGLRNSFAFLFIHLTDNIGVVTANIGMWSAFMAGIEVPFFILTDRFLPKIQSKLAYIAGALGLSIFIFLLGISQHWIIIVFLFLLRGITFPTFQLSSFTMVSEFSQKENVATNQAILQVTIPNIAILLTGSAFGWLYEHMGTSVFFATCALACLIGVAVVAIYPVDKNKPVDIATPAIESASL